MVGDLKLEPPTSGVDLSAKKIQLLGILGPGVRSLLSLLLVCLPLTALATLEKDGCISTQTPLGEQNLFSPPLFAVGCKDAGVCHSALTSSRMAPFRGKATRDGPKGAKM